VRCGDCRDGRPSAAQREVQANIGRTMFGIGVFVVIAAVAVWQIHMNQWPGNEYIASWYDEAYMSAGKRVLRGEDYISWAETGGGILCVLGILASLISRFNAGKPLQ